MEGGEREGEREMTREGDVEGVIEFSEGVFEVGRNHDSCPIEHFFKTLHTVGFTDTHLSKSVNLWCKMHYNHQNTSYFTPKVSHAAVTLAKVLSQSTMN